PPAHPNIHTLSLHDALPISHWVPAPVDVVEVVVVGRQRRLLHAAPEAGPRAARVEPATRRRRHQVRGTATDRPQLGVRRVGDVRDRKSTRLNSSHVSISYAV